jgi:hypothetical protein
LVVQSWRDPAGHEAAHTLSIAPLVVSSSQHTPVMQLLLPEHASESPLHVAGAVHTRPVLDAQQTCVSESHVVAPHAI